MRLLLSLAIPTILTIRTEKKGSNQTLTNRTLATCPKHLAISCSMQSAESLGPSPRHTQSRNAIVSSADWERTQQLRALVSKIKR